MHILKRRKHKSQGYEGQDFWLWPNEISKSFPQNVGQNWQNLSRHQSHITICDKLLNLGPEQWESMAFRLAAGTALINPSSNRWCGCCARWGRPWGLTASLTQLKGTPSIWGIMLMFSRNDVSETNKWKGQWLHSSSLRL